VAEDFNDVRSFTDRAFLYAHRHLPEAYSFLFDESEPIPLSSIGSSQASVGEAVQDCLATVVAKGYRPAVVDLTTPDIRECGYVVTRVMVPGLETMDGDHRLQMLGGDRWRQVPVQLGLRPDATDLDAINPYPHPYP
jgi:ribosomal protein S12 methylthiotransferase accessory factor